jgi:nucleotide-binding universal stress UspA family protein
MPLLSAPRSSPFGRSTPRGPRGHGQLPGADIHHLARHEVRAQIERTILADVSVGDVLLSRAADVGADLLVMGAYGHSRKREALLGGATRTLLRNVAIPVLMSH